MNLLVPAILQNPFILKFVEIYKSLVAIGKHVFFTWIPSHIGIHGNTVVDREAKNALDDTVSNCLSNISNIHTINQDMF
jgi:ribonuclease HI